MTAPYYADDTVTLYAGDCTEVMAGMADNSVDAVVTDPPYNLSFMAKPWDAYEGREDAGFAYWLTGLIDGEGHFGIKAHARGTHAPFFSIKMRADERGTLERIHRSLGVGTLTAEAHDPNPMVKYVIQDQEGCRRLVDLLDKYPLRAKKRLDYWTWRDAVCEWTSRPKGNRWHGPADNTRMAGLRDRLMGTRAYTDVPWSGHEYQDWCRLWAAECLRVLKPGGHLLAFGGTRTHHRLTCAIEDAGFEIRDTITWLYGSGFPKSLDVSKAIDRAVGAKREPGMEKVYVGGHVQRSNGTDLGIINDDGWTPRDGRTVTAPATDAARQWEGWGTALKPSSEMIVVARKPLAGTVAANVQQWGTGALNIDATRVAHGDDVDLAAVQRQSAANPLYVGGAKPGDVVSTYKPGGRWPPNVVLDGHAAAELDRQSGTLHSQDPATRQSHSTVQGVTGFTTQPGINYGDTGGASRFFPVFRYEAKAPTFERPRHDGTSHPTTKPLDLIRWLVRLVVPPGGLCLDPFAGSGTTGEACIIEGFRCLLIEREPDYLPLIVNRLTKPIQPDLFGGAG